MAKQCQTRIVEGRDISLLVGERSEFPAEIACLVLVGSPFSCSGCGLPTNTFGVVNAKKFVFGTRKLQLFFHGSLKFENKFIFKGVVSDGYVQIALIGQWKAWLCVYDNFFRDDDINCLKHHPRFFIILLFYYSVLLLNNYLQTEG